MKIEALLIIARLDERGMIVIPNGQKLIDAARVVDEVLSREPPGPEERGGS